MPTKPKPKPKKQDDLGGIILSSKGMAKLLGITPRWLNKLVNDGEVTAVGRGQFDPYETVQAYAEFLRRGQEKATASDQLDNLRNMRAQEVRLRLMKADRELIHLDEANATLDEIVGMFLAYLSGLPAEITRNPKERARLDGIIDSGRAKLSNRLLKKISALATGSEAADAAAEDDAGKMG